ncbi:MAG: penicillin-binding protein [Proteobacteria bacterium]|nr:penicillin-binding protein [Pseudomonadota bacterium]
MKDYHNKDFSSLARKNWISTFTKLFSARKTQKIPSKVLKRQGSHKRFPFIRIILFLAAAFFTVYHFFPADPEKPSENQQVVLETKTDNTIEREQEGIEESIPIQVEPVKASFNEQFLARQPDVLLGRKLLDVLRSQNAYKAFYLMVDGESGKILAWGQQEEFSPSAEPSFMPKSSFPAASLIKIVTATAALESRRYSNHTLIPSIGSSVTLYRKQLKVPKNYKGRKVSLEKAFASSMNPAMGIVGLSLGGKALKTAATQLGFNMDCPTGLIDQSIFAPPDSGYGVAEAACGFTKEITLSPLHGAAIVRSVLKGKAPEIPWSPLVGAQYAPAKAVPLPVSALSENTYYGLRRMFEATIKKGSARTSFRNPKVLYSYNRKRLRIGGKTGTKDGHDGRYEWFAGYAMDRKDPKKSLVLVCLHINELSGTRASHPAQAAALLINHWAKRYLKW